ncbi:MAG: WHG domain-containing protein [Solirubrobacteraceae bacterium]
MPRCGLDCASVVSAAAQLADSDGLDKLTLARLADRLGVRAPSLYGHVDGLADLRARVGVHGVVQMTAALSAAAAGRAGQDALQAVADAYRQFAHAHPGVYAAMQRAPENLGSDAAAAATRLVEVFVAVLRGYGLQDNEAIHGVRLVRSALHGFIALESDQGFGMPISPEETYQRLIAMLDHGLRAPKSKDQSQ